jgi:hypothetical protein
MNLYKNRGILACLKIKDPAAPCQVESMNVTYLLIMYVEFGLISFTF